MLVLSFSKSQFASQLYREPEGDVLVDHAVLLDFGAARAEPVAHALDEREAGRLAHFLGPPRPRPRARTIDALLETLRR